MTFATMVIVGILAGLAAGWLLHRANAAMTGRMLAAVRPTMPPRADNGALWAFANAERLVSPMTAQRGASGVSQRPSATAETLRHYRPTPGPVVDLESGAYRSYGYELPSKTRRYRRNPLGDAAAGAPIVETLTPAREMNMRSDVGVPIGQSLFSGFVGALVCAVVAWRTGGDVVLWLALGFVGALAVAWLAGLGLARSLVWKVERFIGQDLDGDEVTGDPGHVLLENPGAARNAAHEQARQNQQRVRTADLLAFVSRCAAVGTSEGRLGIAPAPQARARYAELRDTLILLGIGRWKDEDRRKLGWELVLTPEQAAPIISRHVRELRST